MWSFIQDHLATLQGRIAAGSAFASGIAISLIPVAGSQFDVVEFITVMGLAGIWLLAEFSDSKPPSEHDRKLFENYQGYASPDLLNFLREHEFHFSFGRKYIQALNEISYLDGVRHEFVDKKIEKAWSNLQEKVKAFTILAAAKTIPAPGNPGLATVHPNQGDADFPSEETKAEIAELNAAATSLGETMSEFERYARKRLRL